jgi:apolipoprotein D and lipocalin family protein
MTLNASNLVRALVLMTLMWQLESETARAASPGEVTAINDLDLARYVGRWHEIARFPAWFQRRCARDTTADYEQREDGTLRVVNTCVTTEGKTIRAEGRARLADRDGPASRLQVRFAPEFLSWLPMVWGDYWVLDLTADYSAVLVGTPDRRYLWILARAPQLEQALYDRFVATAKAQGFDVSRLEVQGSAIKP